MKAKHLRRIARPVTLEPDEDKLYITLANGRVYSTPLALYHWLRTASLEERLDVEFRRYGLWWPQLENGIYIEELLIASTTEERVEDSLTRLKRQVIIFLENLEARLLRHRIHWLCHAVSFSSWWGEDWSRPPYGWSSRDQETHSP
jgi:hypothetical protein